VKYTDKLKELATWVRRRESGQAHGGTFEIRVDDEDPDYLRVELFEPFAKNGPMVSTGTLVTVSPRQRTGVVFLQVQISATAIGEFSEAQWRLLGITVLYRIAGAFHTRVKGQEFEA